MVRKHPECEDQPRRMIHWTCRRCGAKWSNLVNKGMPNGDEELPDCESESFCDKCLEGMGK